MTQDAAPGGAPTGFCKDCDYQGLLQKATEPGYICPECRSWRVVRDDDPPDPLYAELVTLRAENATLRPHAAAWARLCAIDKERQFTHRRSMLPRGVMDEVNAIAVGKEG